MRQLRNGLAAAALLAGSPVQAADDEQVGILAALGLTAATGETELADGAGAMEGHILSAPLVGKAAKAIKDAIGAGDDLHSIVVLAQGETLDLSLPAVLMGSMLKIEAETPKACPVKRKPGGNKGGKPLSANVGEQEKSETSSRSTTDIFAAAIGALKVDAKVSSFDAGSPEQALIAAIAKGQPHYFVPSEIAAIPSDNMNPLLVKFDDLKTRSKTLEPCKDHKDVKEPLAKLDGLIAAVSKPGENAEPSPLQKAARLSGIALSNPQILRIKLDKAGGTIINKNGILYQFGFPGGLTARAGLVANYRLANPRTGQIAAQGIVVCRQHRKAEMVTIYRKQTSYRDVPEASASCELLTP